MNRFKYRLLRFFSGRYGVDTLGYLLTAVYFLLLFTNLFIPSATASLVVDILSMGVLALLVFRIFSRNIPARRKENDRVTGIFSSVRQKFTLWKAMWRDRKTHIYKKCPSCHAVLRLRKVTGEHTAVCPKCRARVTVKIK